MLRARYVGRHSPGRGIVAATFWLLIEIFNFNLKKLRHSPGRGIVAATFWLLIEMHITDGSSDIDMAHPANTSPHRASKMAVVLKALECYQTSEYDITPLPHVAKYLNSVRYIEELQKFVEDDQYKKTGDMEVKNPLFKDEPTPATPKNEAVKTERDE